MHTDDRLRRVHTAAQRQRYRELNRLNYAKNKATITDKRREHDRSYQRRRRASILAANRLRVGLRLDEIQRHDDDMSCLRNVVGQRRDALQAAREQVGIQLKRADPCPYCGAQLFEKESKGICCKNGKYVLPALAPLPAALNELYTSPEPSAQKFRKESRAYNCRCNFASMNVEDGELKKMFGDHLLSVQGR